MCGISNGEVGFWDGWGKLRFKDCREEFVVLVVFIGFFYGSDFKYLIVRRSFFFFSLCMIINYSVFILLELIIWIIYRDFVI